MSFVERFQPIQDRIIVKRIPKEEKTESGLISLEYANKRVPEGYVLKVGKGRYDEKGNLKKPIVKVGDRIIFHKGAGTNYKFEGEEYLIIREEFIYAILERKENE